MLDLGSTNPGFDLPMQSRDVLILMALTSMSESATAEKVLSAMAVVGPLATEEASSELVTEVAVLSAMAVVGPLAMVAVELSGTERASAVEPLVMVVASGTEKGYRSLLGLEKECLLSLETAMEYRSLLEKEYRSPSEMETECLSLLESEMVYPSMLETEWA